MPGQTLFEQLRAGVLAYLHYDEQHPHGAWAAYVGMGTSDPVLRGIEDTDNERQVNRLLARMNETLGGDLDSKVERDIRITMYGWLAMTMEMCRQRILDPSIDAGQIADTCAHALLDMVGRVPGCPGRTQRGGRARATWYMIFGRNSRIGGSMNPVTLTSCSATVVIRFACRQQPFDIGVGDSRRQRSVALDLGLAEVGAGGESPCHPDRLRRRTEVSPRQIVLAVR